MMTLAFLLKLPILDIEHIQSSTYGCWMEPGRTIVPEQIWNFYGLLTKYQSIFPPTPLHTIFLRTILAK